MVLRSRRRTSRAEYPLRGLFSRCDSADLAGGGLTGLLQVLGADNAGSLQRLDLVIAVAELCQDLLVVLTWGGDACGDWGGD